MNRQEMEAQCKKIMKAIKVSTFSYVLGRTDHGELAYRVDKDVEGGHFTLDAVPLEKDAEKDLLAAL